MKKYRKGFTLIEVLLGLMIFSILALSLYATFRSGMEVNRRSQDINQIYREANMLLERIAKDLENMAWYDFANSYPQMSAFKGEPNQIQFILPAKTGLKVVLYHLKTPEYGSVYKTILGRHTARNVDMVSRLKEESFALSLLVREEKPLMDYLQSTSQEKSEMDVLSINAKTGSLKFSFAYVEGEGENEKIVWKDSWAQRYFPSGIRMEVTLMNPDRPEQPLTVEREVYIPTGLLTKEGPGS